MTIFKKHKHFVRVISFLIIFSLIFQAGPVMALESMEAVSDIYPQLDGITATAAEAEQQQIEDSTAESSAPEEKQRQESA